MKKLMGVLIEIAVIFLIGFICGAIWMSKYEPGWLPDWLGAMGISQSRLHVTKDVQGQFDGTIDVENHDDLNIDVMVTVNLYDGDQNVGDLSGSVTLKPNSDSIVDLVSADRFVSYDNTTVELLPIPGPQPVDN